MTNNPLVCTASLRKGGAGKTALVVNLSAACAAVHGDRAEPSTARAGNRVLVIDLDVQANASRQFGLHEDGADLARALEGRAPLTGAIRPTAHGIDIAPGGEALGRLATTMRRDALQRALASLQPGAYSRVMVDCPPTLDTLVLAAWTASDRILLPLDGPEALEAIAQTQHAWDDLGIAPDYRIVLTRYDRRSSFSRDLRNQAERLYPGRVALPSMRHTVVVQRAVTKREPVIIHAPRHAVSDDVRWLAREVLHG